MTEITKEEYLQWKSNKATKHLVASILTKRQILSEGIIEGALATEEERLIAIGKCQALKDITMFVIEEFDYIQEEEEENNGS